MNEYRWNVLMDDAHRYARQFSRRMAVIGIRHENGWQYVVTTATWQRARRGRP